MICCNEIPEVVNYGSSASYCCLPTPEQVANGVVPLDSLPAAWWNAMWSETNRAVNCARGAVGSLITELNTVLTQAGVCACATCTDQLYQSINIIRQRIADSTTPGAVKSSSTCGQVSVNASGIMTANGLGNTACLNTTSKEATGAINELKSTYDTCWSNNTTALGGKAPTAHASSATTYGVGTSANYGHLKISDTYTSVLSACSGVAASQKAANCIYAIANAKAAVGDTAGCALGTAAAGTATTAARSDHVHPKPTQVDCSCKSYLTSFTASADRPIMVTCPSCCNYQIVGYSTACLFTFNPATGEVKAKTFCGDLSGCAADSNKFAGCTYAQAKANILTGCAADSNKFAGCTYAQAKANILTGCAADSAKLGGTAATCYALKTDCVACAGANGSGTAFGSAATKTAGAAAGNVPLVGAALGTTNNNIVVTDTAGKLKPSGTVLGSAAGKTAGSAKGNVPLINSSAGLGTTNNNIIVTDTSGNLKASGTALGTAAGCASTAFRASTWVPNMNDVTNATSVQVEANNITRKYIVANQITGSGYITRAAIGLKRGATNWGTLLLSVGCNDAGTAFYDYEFDASGNVKAACFCGIADKAACNASGTAFGTAAVCAADCFAPKAHAAAATTYGAGDASNYGHVKLSDTYSSSSNGTAACSVGASQCAVYAAYTEARCLGNATCYSKLTADACTEAGAADCTITLGLSRSYRWCACPTNICSYDRRTYTKIGTYQASNACSGYTYLDTCVWQCCYSGTAGVTTCTNRRFCFHSNGMFYAPVGLSGGTTCTTNIIHRDTGASKVSNINFCVSCTSASCTVTNFAACLCGANGRYYGLGAVFSHASYGCALEIIRNAASGGAAICFKRQTTGLGSIAFTAADTLVRYKTDASACYQILDCSMAGSAVGNVAVVGTALGTIADKIVLTDANGKLKPSANVVGEAAYCAVGTAANAVPKIGAALSANNGYLVATDASGNLKNIAGINVYCGTTCKCCVSGATALCLGSNAFNSTAFTTIANKAAANSDTPLALCTGATSVGRSTGCALTFNTCTGELKAGTFIGSLSGHASTATNANHSLTANCSCCVNTIHDFPGQITIMGMEPKIFSCTGTGTRTVTIYKCDFETTVCGCSIDRFPDPIVYGCTTAGMNICIKNCADYLAFQPNLCWCIFCKVGSQSWVCNCGKIPYGCTCRIACTLGQVCICVWSPDLRLNCHSGAVSILAQNTNYGLAYLLPTE